ncbi:hypothetical protein M2399_000758 [Pseudomonas sp. BIGb0450]|uniref:hypothetical protein n=1 Tax=Pseudomonas TaxID=286 RepID=UPI00210DB319|nr:MULTISPECIES: hypothetical protein [Pseudomonas]MCS3415159.1 hypothetical protein [Pseudomonas sp. BIGb0558]MCS3435338.1 hypothetical protein [Pseudomonas sp. BIGb0450]
MTNSTTPLWRCAVHGDPGSLRIGLLLFLLLLVIIFAKEARADTCRLSLSQSRVDYGVIRPPERAGSASLVTRTLHLNIVCADPSIMALRFNGVPADGQSFRFGRLGRFALGLKHAQVDGQAVEWATVQLPGEPAPGRLVPGHVLLAQTAGARALGRRLTAQVEIDVDLPSAAYGVRGETLLEGLGSFELVRLAVPQSQ